MRERVLRYIRDRRLLLPGDRLGVAVSGGADSVALLRVLAELQGELGLVLTVAHFHHGLRAEAADADECFVRELANQHGLSFCVGHGDVSQYAAAKRIGVEQAAHELRYSWLADLARSESLNVLATAHTMDDQAETVLLKVLRGAGTRGLGGIYPEIRATAVCPRLVRPLLGVSRRDVEEYLAELNQPWRQDETNREMRFTRNRVRHELLPILERGYNPNIRRTLNQLSEWARGEQEYWDALLAEQLERRQTEEHRFDLRGWNELPVAVRRRLLKAWLERLGIAIDFEHIQMLAELEIQNVRGIELAGGWRARHIGACLSLERFGSVVEKSLPSYRYQLPVPGKVEIAELGAVVEAELIPATEAAGRGDTDSLLDAELLGKELVIRNWQPGDRFWPFHSRTKEKLKRLFAERKIPAESRQSWPVAIKGDEIVWVRGFPAATDFEWNFASREAVNLKWIPDGP